MGWNLSSCKKYYIECPTSIVHGLINFFKIDVMVNNGDKHVYVRLTYIW